MSKKIAYIIAISLLTSLIAFSNSKAVNLSTGETISLLSETQITTDWDADFNKNKDKLLENRKIADYLDSKKGFSAIEKGYWIAFYGKSSNINKISKENDIVKIINQIYFLQRIYLETSETFKSEIFSKLNKAIYLLYPRRLSHNDIMTIRTTSCRDFLINNLKVSLKPLDLKSQNLIARYYMDQNENNKRKALQHYSNLLNNFSLEIEDYHILKELLKANNKASKELSYFKADDKPKGLEINKIEKEQIKILKASLKKINYFIIVLFKLKKHKLAKEAIQRKNLLIVNLKKRFPNTKNLIQSQNKE